MNNEMNNPIRNEFKIFLRAILNNPKAIAEEMGISVNTLYTWMNLDERVNMSAYWISKLPAKYRIIVLRYFEGEEIEVIKSDSQFQLNGSCQDELNEMSVNLGYRIKEYMNGLLDKIGMTKSLHDTRDICRQMELEIKAEL